MKFSYFSNLYKKPDLINQNPIRAGRVKNPEEFLYSSAIDYAGIRGYVKIMKFE